MDTNAFGFVINQKMRLNKKTNFGMFYEPDNRKQFGFIIYNSKTGSIIGMQANDAKELAYYNNVDETIYDNWFKLSVGESICEDTIITRIW